MKIIGLGGLIAQMKRQDTLVAMQKTSTLIDVPLLKKSRKNPPKWSFLWVFLDFFSNGTLYRVKVFFVAMSAPWGFISAIKHPKTMISIYLLIMGFPNFQTPWTSQETISGAFRLVGLKVGM